MIGMINRLGGMAVAELLQAYASWTAYAGNTGKSAVFMFNNVNIGVARANRLVIAALQSGNDTSGVVPVNTLTVGGVALTKHAEAWPNPDNNRGYAIFSGIVPNGETAQVIVEAAASKAQCHLSVYDATVNDPVPYAIYSDVNKSGNSGVTANISGGSLVVGVSAPGVVWTGLPNVQNSSGVSTASLSNADGNSGLAIGTNSTDYLLVACWR